MHFQLGASSGGSTNGGAASTGTSGTVGTSTNSAPGSGIQSQQSTEGANSNASQGGALTPPIVPPGTTGSVGSQGNVSSGAPRQGPGAGGSAWNQTGLGNMGPETEKEQQAQEQSDKATKSICIDANGATPETTMDGNKIDKP